MNKQQPLYDVYVSYPPNIDQDKINACIRDNLSDSEAEELIKGLAEKKQVIIAEWCTRDEWENAQQYFSYLGLDVITRQSLELEQNHAEEPNISSNETCIDCPVCNTVIEDIEHIDQCPTCGLLLKTASENTIQHKRIEWQERIAFESLKQQEIAYKLEQQKRKEEARLRKQIRAELEKKLRQELDDKKLSQLKSSEKKSNLTIVLGCLLAILLIGVGYIIAKIL